jgi:hypothetical protein
MQQMRSTFVVELVIIVSLFTDNHCKEEYEECNSAYVYCCAGSMFQSLRLGIAIIVSNGPLNEIGELRIVKTTSEFLKQPAAG